MLLFSPDSHRHYWHPCPLFTLHHYTQTQQKLSRCPSASLDYIIEPWFLGPGATSPGGPEFNEWAEESKKAHGTVFGTSIKDLPPPKEPRCALISGRTADNPRLFAECIEAGCKTIFLEKPGAPTVRPCMFFGSSSFDCGFCWLWLGVECLMIWVSVNYL